MKTLLKFAAVAFITGLLHAEPPSKDYELLYEDNFDGTSLKESEWEYRTGRRTGLGMDGMNFKENVSVSGGQLRIAARQEVIDGKPESTGGGVISKHQLGYGYYETLSKPFMGGTGVHTSFWQRGGSVPNNNIFEIDSYEIDSPRLIATNNLYLILSPKPYKEAPWPHRANVPFTLRPDGSFLDGYEYTPDGVTFYDNGKVVAKAEFKDLTAAQRVWLTALNGCGKVDPRAQPGESTFDYFRYYARDFPGANILPNGSFEYNQDKIDPGQPVAWQHEKGAAGIRVARGDAARDSYKLRLGRDDAPFDLKLHQTLEFIRNGDYQLTAMARRSAGLEVAKIVVSNFGGDGLQVDIPASDKWTPVKIPAIPVSSHGITIGIVAAGKAGEWLEIDEVEFMKPPLPGQPARQHEPFVPVGDPIWALAKTAPITFSGDPKFYFFDRCVGFGDAITVAFTLNAKSLARMSPIARIPAKGNAGWAIQLTADGGLIFRIGSGENHRDVLAKNAYAAGRDVRITCVFDRGTARIYADGRLLKTESGITQTTDDATKAGQLGTTGDTFDAVGDVTGVVEPSSKPAGRMKNEKFAGSLGDVRIYNRALSEREISAAAQ